MDAPDWWGIIGRSLAVRGPSRENYSAFTGPRPGFSFAQSRLWWRGMFSDLLQFITRRPPEGYEQAFVDDGHVLRPLARNPRAEKFILLCSGLFVLKPVPVICALHRY